MYESSRVKEANQVPITAVSFSAIVTNTLNKFQRCTVIWKKTLKYGEHVLEIHYKVPLCDHLSGHLKNILYL
jgi:hypothetical protein